MECFRLLFDHLAWIEHQFFSGKRNSKKAGSLWGIVRGVGGVRKSIHQSRWAKGLGLLCWGFKGVQKKIPSEEASTLQIGSVAFPPGQCTSPQLHLCHRLFDQDGHQDSSSPYSPDFAPCDFWLFPKPLWDNWVDERGCDEGHWHAHARGLPWGLPEVVVTVQQVHCSRGILLRRGLEFHVCTINKSAHTKKVWKLIVCPSYYIRKDNFKFRSQPFWNPRWQVDESCGCLCVGASEIRSETFTRSFFFSCCIKLLGLETVGNKRPFHVWLTESSVVIFFFKYLIFKNGPSYNTRKLVKLFSFIYTESLT